MELIGRVVSVNISREKGTPKAPTEVISLKENFGVENDAHGGSKREVSLLSTKDIETMRKKGLPVGPGSFAENITVEGELEVRVGDKIIVGEAVLEVTEIGKECHDACWIKREVGSCIMPRKGIFARVVKGGTVKAGDRVFRLTSGESNLSF